MSNQTRSQIFVRGVRSRRRVDRCCRRRGVGVGQWGGVWGEGVPSPLGRKFWDFFTWNGSFRWKFRYVYFNRNVRLFTARTTRVRPYCILLATDGVLLRGRVLGIGLWPLPIKLFDFFHLKLLILVQIQLYFNRNVRQFIARTTTVTCTHVTGGGWGGGGSIEPVKPPRYGPANYEQISSCVFWGSHSSCCIHRPQLIPSVSSTSPKKAINNTINQKWMKMQSSGLPISWSVEWTPRRVTVINLYVANPAVNLILDQVSAITP